MTPESGSSGIYHDADVYTYNAHLHPEYSTPTAVVVSYNVNSVDTLPGGDLYRRVGLYRPRFVVISLGWNGAGQTSPGAMRHPCP